MEKTKCLILLLCLFCIGQVFAQQQCGDINNDNAIDILDALLIAQDYVGDQVLPGSIADVNSDNSVDIIDALLIAQFYVGIIDALPGCPGSDPTPVPGRNKCMLITCDPGYENEAYDDFIIPLLESWGFIIDKKHFSADVASYTAADYEPYDFIFVSETVLSDDAVPLKEIPLPMLCSDGWMAKEASLGFAIGSPCDMPDAEPIIFLDEAAGHPLAAGFTPGTVIDLCDASDLLVWGQPTIPIIPIAGLESNPERLLVYGIEAGTINTYGDSIQNRVAMIGVHAFGYETLTAEAEQLYIAGINWILAE